VPATQVIIIGGGIVGAACAHELTQRGHRVTIIDRGIIGHGCSYGNAGWIVPSHSLPLPQPGVLAKAGKFMLDPESPFYIKPRLSWELLGWLASFARHANEAHLYRGGRALVELAQASLEYYTNFAAAGGAATGFCQRGMIHLCATERMLEEVVKEAKLLAGFGVPARVLDRDELYAIEPALRPGLVGAVHFTAEAHAEPLKMVQAFVKSAADRGATICERTELIDFDRRDNRIEAVLTTRGRLRADHFVLAAGSWSSPLGKRLGIHLPIQPAKGYAVFMEQPDPMPTYPAMLDEHKIGVTPRDGSLKLAGTLELAGMDESITKRRVDAIIRGAQKFYYIPAEPKILEIWRGLRPCTPDGLPAIGPAPASRAANLILASGHAMLGLTLAPGTAMLVADMIEHKSPWMDMTPFSPARF